MADKFMEVSNGVKKTTQIALKFSGIAPKGVNGKAGTVGITLAVKDLTKFHEIIKEEDGLTIIQEPTREEWGGFLAVYLGPDGSELSVLEEWQETEQCNAKKATEEETKEETKKEIKEEKQKSAGEGICHIEIPCGDQERVNTFFTESFGWSFSKWGNEYYFTSNDPEYKLQGGLLTSDERIKVGAIYLNVHDISASLEKIKNNGGKIIKEKYCISPDHPGKFAAKFEDTEGNVWALYCDESKRVH